MTGYFNGMSVLQKVHVDNTYCKQLSFVATFILNFSLINWFLASNFHNEAFFIHIGLHAMAVLWQEIFATIRLT
jgi:hypothetical protein